MIETTSSFSLVKRTAGTLAMLSIAAVPTPQSSKSFTFSENLTHTIKSTEHTSTHGNHINIFTGKYPLAERTNEYLVAIAYEKLIGTQKELAPDFARILSDNLWALYER